MGIVRILSGPVGAGKTTVGRALVARLPDPVAYVEGDTFWSFLVRQSAPDHRSFVMIVRAMLAAARHFQRDGYDTIVDFSIPPSFLDAARKLLNGNPFDYVVVRPSEAVCAARAAARPEGTVADYARFRDLYRSFDGVEARHVIADDASDAATIAARIAGGFDAGTFRVA